ncbi:MAG: SDR family NAD(P)-dependent oxidoreductase [Firmicutes bacterium]|nr:SDR family NAD(P)-dependent oxidoreductase [Bacillota bacterium]
MDHRPVAVITGATSGIGQSTAQLLAQNGYDIFIGGRRADRLENVRRACAALGAKAGAQVHDVRDNAGSEQFVEGALEMFGRIDVLVNNAGLARGLTHIADQQDETPWQEMIDTNVMGLLRMTRLVIPHMIAKAGGHIVNIGSTAAHEAYAGGAVYAATKHAVRAITTALRLEVLGQPIRVTEIDPGMVETEFSRVRFSGDKARADSVYAGVTPLTADDIADVILFALTRKPHVNIDMLVLRPRDQGSQGAVARRNV